MIQFYKGKLILILFPLFIALFSACDKDMSVFLDRNSNDALSVSIIDSMSVTTSTFQLDYMPGANTGVVLVGKTSQAEIGSVKSTAYFELGLQDYIAGIPENAVFDSVNMVLRPHSSRYYYGDTTVVNNISVHQVTKRFETTDITTGIDASNAPVFVSGPTIFNNTVYPYDATPLGTKSFRPRIRSMDSLDIRLDQTFGATFFDLMRTTDIKTTNTDFFLDYLNGIALVSDENNKALLGFSDTVQIRFNYSYINTAGFKVNEYKLLNLGNRTYQYNNFEYDRTGTPFEALSETKRELTLAETNGKLFFQAGTGVVTKITLKSLQDLMRESNIAINKAELIIETSSAYDGSFPASTTAMLFVANSNNVPIYYLTAPYSSSIQQAVFTAGNQTGKNNTYTFDLIEYTKSITTNAYYDTSLFLSVMSPALFNSTNASVIATQNNAPKIKLNIIYTKFQ